MMLPFVKRDWLWQTGLAGSIASGFCFVVAGGFLFAASRRLFGTAPALASVSLYACLTAILYFTVRFRERQGWGAAWGASIAALLGTLARYEGWFLLPFVAAYFFFTAKRRRWGVTILFCAIAGAGPLYWLFHHWWLTGDALDFYRGPYSAVAIQAGRPYPGHGDWRTACLYVWTAVWRTAGPVLVVMALAGAVAAFARRAVWPMFLLLLPPAFYVWSMHSSANPIFMPGLPYPYSFYNTRYGLSAFCLLVFCAGALVSAWPAARGLVALLVVLAAGFWWMIHPAPVHWITWEESRVNSEGRRAWTHDAAQYLHARYVPGSGIVSSFSDLTGIYREAGIPFREVFSECNGLPFDAAMQRPELYLWQEWAVAAGGDAVQTAVNRANRQGPCYSLERTIIVKDAPVIEIYRRTGGCHGGS